MQRLCFAGYMFTMELCIFSTAVVLITRCATGEIVADLVRPVHRIYIHIRLKPHPHDMTPSPGYVAALPFLHDMLRRHCPCDIPRDMVSRTADPPVHARRYPQRLVAFLHSQEDPFKGWSALGIIPVASQASGGLLVGQVGPRLCPPAFPIVHPSRVLKCLPSPQLRSSESADWSKGIAAQPPSRQPAARG
jgi:hypothetical protein